MLSSQSTTIINILTKSITSVSFARLRLLEAQAERLRCAK